MAITYRKLKDGNWGVFGPASEVKAGQVTVTKKDQTTKSETVLNTSKPFVVDGVPHVYGFLAPRKKQGGGGSYRGQQQRGRKCKSDGNCSSFGDGKSCGGSDCDGW